MVCTMQPPSQPTSQQQWQESDFELLVSHLPASWEQDARSHKAFQRARKVRSPRDLLRLVLTCAGSGLSLQRAAETAESSGMPAMSKVAVWGRMQAVGEWLARLIGEMLSRHVVCPAVAGYHPRVMDASRVAGPGCRAELRLHYSVSLTSLCCTDLVITDGRVAESFANFSAGQDDLLLGDRIYARAKPIAAVRRAGAEVLVRLGRTSLTLYDEQGAKLDWLGWCRALPDAGPAQRFAQFRDETGAWISGRVCAVRLNEAQAQRARKRCVKQAKRRGTRTRPRTLEAAGYVCLFTTAPQERLPLDMVCALYRARWQIELSFKRLKSLLRAGELRQVTQRSALIWLRGKMLYALLLEACLQQAGAFSPR